MTRTHLSAPVPPSVDGDGDGDGDGDLVLCPQPCSSRAV
jgi:hypothetical protein